MTSVLPFQSGYFSASAVQAAGAALAAGAKLITIPGMGHDLPEALWGEITDAIVANIERAVV